MSRSDRTNAVIGGVRTRALGAQEGMPRFTTRKKRELVPLHTRSARDSATEDEGGPTSRDGRRVRPNPYVDEKEVDHNAVQLYARMLRDPVISTCFKILTHVALAGGYKIMFGGAVELPIVDADLRHTIDMALENAVAWYISEGFIPFHLQPGGIERDAGRGYYEDLEAKRKRKKRRVKSPVDADGTETQRSTATATMVSTKMYDAHKDLPEASEPVETGSDARAETQAPVSSADDGTNDIAREDLEFTVPPPEMGKFTSVFDTRDHRYKLFYRPQWESEYERRSGRTDDISHLSEAEKREIATHMDSGHWLVHVESQPTIGLDAAHRVPNSMISQVMDAYTDYQIALQNEHVANSIASRHVTIEHERPPAKGDKTDGAQYNATQVGLPHNQQARLANQQQTARREALAGPDQQLYEQRAYRVPEGYVYAAQMKPQPLVKASEKYEKYVETVAIVFGIPRHMLMRSESRYKASITEEDDELLVGGTRIRRVLSNFFHSVMSHKNGEKIARIIRDPMASHRYEFQIRHELITQISTEIAAATTELLAQRATDQETRSATDIVRAAVAAESVPAVADLKKKKKQTKEKEGAAPENPNALRARELATAIDGETAGDVHLPQKIQQLNQHLVQLRDGLEDIGIGIQTLSTLVNTGRMISLFWPHPVVTHTSNIPNISSNINMTPLQQTAFWKSTYGISS